MRSIYRELLIGTYLQISIHTKAFIEKYSKRCINREAFIEKHSKRNIIEKFSYRSIHREVFKEKYSQRSIHRELSIEKYSQKRNNESYNHKKNVYLHLNNVQPNKCVKNKLVTTFYKTSLLCVCLLFSSICCHLESVRLQTIGERTIWLSFRRGRDRPRNFL